MSCNYANNNDREKSKENKTELKEDTSSNAVTLSIEPEILLLSSLPDTVIVTMSNKTDETISTGLHYSIEAFKNNDWQEVSPKEMVFHDIGFNLEPSDQQYFEKLLVRDHINYQPGKYRIVKYYLKPDFQVTKELYYSSVEFTIE